jgi:hypothetical protein
LADALAAAEEGRVNTDDRPILEFGFARNLGRRGLFRISALRELAEEHGGRLPAAIHAAIDSARLDDFRAARQLALRGTPTAPVGAEADAKTRNRARRAFRDGDLAAACRSWQAQPDNPGTPIDRLLVAECLASEGDERALPWIERLALARPADARLVLARWSFAREDWSGAGRLLEEGLAALDADPWVFQPTLQRALLLARPLAKRDPEAGRRLFERLRRPLPVYLLDEVRRRQLVDLARELDFEGLCVEAFAASEPSTPWEAVFLGQRLDCYRAAGHPRAAAAERELERFLDAAPPELAAGLAGRP